MAKPNLNHYIRESLRESVMKPRKPAIKKPPVSGGFKALGNRNNTDNRDTTGGTD